MSKRYQFKHVRLAFPSIFDKSEFEGKEGKFQATLLFPKDHPQFKEVVAAIKEKMAEVKCGKLSPDRICFRDGNDTEYDGFDEHWYLRSSSEFRPTVVDQYKNNVVKEDGVVYAGCYVNVIVDFWFQNNKYGKRINCNLYGVQFAGEGDAFGTARVDVRDEFEAVELETGTGDQNGDPFGGGEEATPADEKPKGGRGKKQTQAQAAQAAGGWRQSVGLSQTRRTGFGPCVIIKEVNR